MIRFVGATGASVFGWLAVLMTALRLGERIGVLRAFSLFLERALIGDFAALLFVLSFVGAILALGALIYGIALEDDFLKPASWAIVITLGLAFVSLTVLNSFYFAGGIRSGATSFYNWPHYLLYFSAIICALVAALRDEELPALDELSPSHVLRPRSAQEVDFSQPAHARAQMQDSMLPIYVLSVLAILGLLAASFLPVLGSIERSYFFNKPSFRGTVLLEYAPLFGAVMLVPVAALGAALVSERTDLRKLASGAGALLTIAMLLLLLRDAWDTNDSYTYGLFRGNRNSGDILGTGFWLLAYSGLCWSGVFFDGFKFLGQMPALAARTKSNRAALAPVDAVELAQRFLFSTLIFIFCASCFPLGIFLWRYFDEQDNRLVNAALAGWLVGLVFALLRLFLIFFIGAAGSDN